MTDLILHDATPWAPHPTAAPLAERDPQGDFIVAANGTRTCCGGWSLHYLGVTPGEAYSFRVAVTHTGLAHPRDALHCTVTWGALGATQAMGRGVKWDHLIPREMDRTSACFSNTLTAPEGATDLTIRCTFRWSAVGRTVWSLPQIAPAEARPSRAVQICVVTGTMDQRRAAKIETLADNLAYYRDLCQTAARALHPDLLVLPEVCLQWQLPGSALDHAVPAPGPETDVFARLAREHGARILLPIFEREGDAVYNTALLIGPDGQIDGKYRKVHLATSEGLSGVLPGDAFPVFDTELGRLGCNICMDSSAAESSRLVGLNGADFLLMPIMGDFRADRWSPGPPHFSGSRWTAIMRVRALDNQLCMVLARNEAEASCIIDRRGDVLAWNEGDQPFIHATVQVDDGYRHFTGGCMRQITWLQRRPHLYGAFTDPQVLGSVGF